MRVSSSWPDARAILCVLCEAQFGSTLLPRLFPGLFAVLWHVGMTLHLLSGTPKVLGLAPYRSSARHDICVDFCVEWIAVPPVANSGSVLVQ